MVLEEGVLEKQVDISDVQALVSMCLGISGEIALAPVTERVILAAVAQSGAKRGLLLLRDTGVRVVVEAVVRDSSVLLVRRPFGTLDVELPAKVMYWVRQTFRPVILGDATTTVAQSIQPFLETNTSPSMLCIPLLGRERLVGALYLENFSASHISAIKLAFLQMLASQATVSMENAEQFRDIQQARDQASKWSEELRRYFDNLPVMAWQNSDDGALEFANKRWHDYTGSSPDDDPLEVWSYFHPDDRQQVAERWRHLLESRTSGEIEARMRRFDGEYRRFLVRAAPLLDESGAIVKWHGTNTDIEDIKRAEEAHQALARVSRITAMGELSVSIAHEINQPLMAIVTNAATCLRWLADERVNVSEARSAAERIVRDGHRAGDVIASIRSMARQGPIQSVEVDLNEVITEVLIMARNELQKHEIVVETRLAADAHAILGDRVQIQQVVLNLVINGIEAMTAEDSAPRLLSVQTVNFDDRFVQASVSDSGHGLDPKNADRIFGAFFTTKVDGLGMGLAICRSIVENHKGRLTVSANRSRGCTFCMELPSVEEGRSSIGLR